MPVSLGDFSQPKKLLLLTSSGDKFHTLAHITDDPGGDGKSLLTQLYTIMNTQSPTSTARWVVRERDHLNKNGVASKG